MEYAKDIIYNLKYDRLVSKNKSRTGKLIKTIINDIMMYT